jgi:dipeptidyl aminopeptidase/acylaminoacyl peptidase
MFLPDGFDSARRYPLVDHIYPGPQVAHKPQLYESLTAAMPMALSRIGFVVIMLDTRGVPTNSRRHHQAGYGHLLEPQLADHAAVIRQLCDRHSFLDRARVGVVGASGGGAAAARALFDYGDVYKVGVAICGNHDSSHYAAIWSDKYRGPGSPQAWIDQSNAAAAHKLQGRLLLISGDMDENVHVSQTLALTDALIRAHKDFDLLIVPNAGHDVAMTNGYTQRRVWDYFVRYLLGAQPPENFALTFTSHELAQFTRRCRQEAS